MAYQLKQFIIIIISFIYFCFCCRYSVESQPNTASLLEMEHQPAQQRR